MKILFLCHRLPYPPDKGEKTRAFHQLRAIASRHDVDLFTLVDDARDLEHREALAAYCHGVTVARVFPRFARLRSLRYAFTPTPLTIPYFFSATLRAAVLDALSTVPYDLIFVYCSAMAQYAPLNSDWLRRRVPAAALRIPVVIDMVDVDSDKWAQYAAATRWLYSAIFLNESRRLRAYERRICEASASVLVATERESTLARTIAPGASIHVVPVGVDTTYFVPGESRRQPHTPTVIFSGDMSYLPNRRAVGFFAGDVLPLIRREVPNARFLIVGRNPTRDVEALRAVAGVEVTGAVPDVRPWFARASVAVAPMTIATGIQTKILEAMASGLPVVATCRAVQGIKPLVAAAIDTAETPQELATEVIHLLLDEQRARHRGAEARRSVAANYGWEGALSGLLQLLERATTRDARGDRVVDPEPSPIAFSSVAR